MENSSSALRRLYFTRTTFSICWVVLVSLFGKSAGTAATILLIIYPAWDVLCSIWDTRIDPTSKTTQYINAAISSVTTLAVGIAISYGISQALIVFGAWAILTGAIQLVLGLRRRKLLGGQWPMIISGGQSVLGGTSFILLSHDPKMGISSLEGYAAFGAFYFLLSAIRLRK